MQFHSDTQHHSLGTPAVATNAARQRARRAAPIAILAVLLSAAAARAQEVGTIAALEGTGEIARGSTRLAAALGAAVHQGDELRTGNPGRVRIVFQDDSVLTVSDGSRVVVDEQVFNPSQGRSRSLFGLLQGKVSAVVSEYYHQPGSSYQIKTATAVAGVRGTEFVVVYDPRTQQTDVAGVNGYVEVRSLFERGGSGVMITAGELSTVARNAIPSAPQRLSKPMFRQYMEGVDFIGAGASESLTVNNALVAGQSVPPPDRAGETASSRASNRRARLFREPRDATGILEQPPSIFNSNGSLNVEF
jgi:hypothetical protein